MADDLGFDAEDIAGVDSVLAAVRDQVRGSLRDRDTTDQALIRAGARRTAAALRAVDPDFTPTVEGDTIGYFERYGRLLAESPEKAEDALRERKDRRYKTFEEKAAEKARKALRARGRAGEFIGLAEGEFRGLVDDDFRGVAPSRGFKGTSPGAFKGLPPPPPVDRDRERPKRLAKAITAPPAPGSYMDALAPIRVLDVWRGRPVAEVDSMVQEMAKRDPYAAEAIRSPPNWFQRSTMPGHDDEVRRIINSEWRIDMTLDGYDFSLPVSARAPALDPAQQRIVEVMRSVASRSALHGRYSDAGFDVNSPLGVQLFSRRPGDAPGDVQALLRSANWSMGLHDLDFDPFGAVARTLGDPRKDFFAKGVDFVGSFFVPAVRDHFGTTFTFDKVDIAQARTMFGMRHLFGGAEETELSIAPNGEIMARAKARIPDPLSDRKLFTPTWDRTRARYIWDVIDKSDPELYTLDASSTPSRPKVLFGEFFSPYDQERMAFGTDARAMKNGKFSLTHEVELDHIVALNYAWTHGFRDRYVSVLSDKDRLADLLRFMSDFGEGRGLFAGGVNFALTRSSVNREKSNKGPNLWLPHPSGADAREHAANLFYVDRHEHVQRLLKLGQSRFPDWIDPEFMASSRAERLAIERVRLGWDRFDEGSLPARLTSFYQDQLLHPDTRKDPLYIQARQYAALVGARLAWGAFTWRLMPYNQAYLMGRKYLIPGMKYGAGLGYDAMRRWNMMRRGASVFDAYEEVPRRAVPSVYREARARPLTAQGTRNFFYEAARQGSSDIIFDEFGEVILHAENRVLLPSLWQATKYAAGAKDPFGVGSGVAKPPAWRLRNTDGFLYHQGEFIDRFLGGDASILSKGGPDWWQRLPPDRRRSLQAFWAGEVERFGLDAPRGVGLPADVLGSLRREALESYQSRFRMQTTIRPGRVDLDASPLLTDLYRIQKTHGWKGGILPAAEAVALDLSVKAVDYGVRGVLRGGTLDAYLGLFMNYGSLVPVEAVAGMTATLTRQTAYIAPLMGRTSVLGHRPFALPRALLKPTLRHFGARARAGLGLTLRSFQPVGGLARLEQIRRELEGGALAAEAAVGRTQALVDQLGVVERADWIDRRLVTLANSRAEAIGTRARPILSLRSQMKSLEQDAAYWSRQVFRQNSRYAKLLGDVGSDVERRASLEASRLARLSSAKSEEARAALKAHASELDEAVASWRPAHDLAANQAEFESLTEQLRRHEALSLELREQRRTASAARARFNAAFADDAVPSLVRRGMNSRGVSRLLTDLAVTNPRMTMLAGRALHAPMSVVRSAGRVGASFTYEGLGALTFQRSQFVGMKRNFARGARYGGILLSGYGGYESLRRFDEVSDLLNEGDSWSDMPLERKSMIASYANRGIRDVLWDEGASLAFLDPIGLATAKINAKGSSMIRSRLLDDASYRRDLLRPALRGDESLAGNLRRREKLRALAEAGYYSLVPGESQPTEERLRVLAMAHEASLNRALERREQAHTDKQRSATAKALEKAKKAAEWLQSKPALDGGADVAEHVLRENSRFNRGKASPGGRVRLIGSTPMRLHEGPVDAFRADSLGVALVLESQRLGNGATPEMLEALDIKRRALTLANLNRGLLKAAPTDTSGGFFERTFNRIDNRNAVRDVIDARTKAMTDSIWADNQRSVMARARDAARVESQRAGPGLMDPRTPRPLQRLWRGLSPLKEWEVMEATVDTLQAARRRATR